LQRLETVPFRVVATWRAAIFVGALAMALLFAGLMDEPGDFWYAYLAADVMFSIGAMIAVQRAGPRAVVAHLALAAAWNLGAFFLATLA
jgi:hypothetical protein